MLKIGGLLLMILLNAFLLNKAIIQHRVIKIPSHIISLIFIILSLPLIHLESHWGATISMSLLILVYAEIINLADSINIKKIIFKTGFIVGLLIMIDYHFSWFYFIILVSLLYYSQFNWKHFFIQLIGFVYPIGTYYVLSVMSYQIILNPGKLDLVFSDKYYFDDYHIFLSIIFILLILSINELYHNYYRKKENAKKAFNLLLFFSIIILLQTIASTSLTFIHLMIIPMTIIFSNYLIYTKHKKFRTFLLGLLFISFIFKFVYL